MRPAWLSKETLPISIKKCRSDSSVVERFACLACTGPGFNPSTVGRRGGVAGVEKQKEKKNKIISSPKSFTIVKCHNSRVS